MKRIGSFAGLLCLVWGLAPVAAAYDKSVPPGKAFVYKQSHGEPQVLEVYFPPHHDPAQSRVPGVLLFHGGGWVSGQLDQFRYQCRYLAGRGLVAATAGYYMVPKGKQAAGAPYYKDGCITDAKSAIRWMKGHAGQLGMDPHKLIVGGGSAGGHLAVLATLNPGLNDPRDPNGIDTRAVAYLLFNPAFAAEDSEHPEANVLNFLTADFPPAIVFFGTQDGWKAGWDKAWEKLQDLGAKNRIDYWTAEGAGHGFFNDSPWKELTLIKADRFLVSLGLLQGEPTLAPPPGGAVLEKVQP